VVSDVNEFFAKKRSMREGAGRMSWAEQVAAIGATLRELVAFIVAS
jgi:hypothetical protein